jgi:dehydrodolichyl diphosphate syntase complex subunit NUS1
MLFTHISHQSAESMSEPELALICYGSAHRYIELGGFLPWHMRLTEFM